MSMRTSGTFLFLAVLSSLVQAQTLAGVSAIDETIVVSGYRPVSMQEADSSISLLNRQTLEQASLSNFEELVQLVPNMNLSGEGTRARYFQLRGVGEREQYEGAPNPSVGFIVDDIDLSGIAGIASTFDVDQVEVLRGPQSARYGSSALAGIVYMRSAMPADSFALNGTFGAGNEDTYKAGLAVTGPLSDSLSGRLSVHQYGDNGFRRNAFLGRDDTNERDELTVRAKLQWDAGHGWQTLLTLLRADSDNGYDAFALDNSDVTFSDEPGRDEQSTTAGSFKVTGPLNDAMDFVSISAFADSDIFYSYDGDWVDESFWLPIVSDYRYINPRERKSISQEFRLVSAEGREILNGSSDWVLGMSWAALDEDNRIDSTGEYVDTAVGCDPGFCITDRQISSRFESDSLAFFAALDSSLSDRLNLSLGLRAERWEADYRDDWVDNGVFGGPVTASNRFKPSDHLLGGHIALAYDLNSSAHVYARIAKGFKAGGFNPSLAALGGLPGAPGPERIPYEPESLWNYELGLKAQSQDGVWQAAASAFYMRRDDAQLSQSDQVDPFDPNSFFFTTSNGDADVYGIELSGQYEFSRNWRLLGSLGLLDTDIQTWNVRPDVVGRSLAHAPDYSLNVGVVWSGLESFYIRADVVAVDEFYFDISHDQKSSSYALLNLRAGKEWGSYSVDVWARNVLDKRYATRGFFFGNEPPAFAPKVYTRFGAPRQVGVSISFSY